MWSKRDPSCQIVADDLAVVDVEEFRRHEPDRQAADIEPGVGQEQEVDVQAGQAADLHPQRSTPLASANPTLFKAIQMVVPDVGRVGQDQVRPSGPVGIDPGEVADASTSNPRPAPDLIGQRRRRRDRARRRLALINGPGRSWRVAAKKAPVPIGGVEESNGVCDSSSTRRRARRRRGRAPGAWRTGRAGSARPVL